VEHFFLVSTLFPANFLYFIERKKYDSPCVVNNFSLSVRRAEVRRNEKERKDITRNKILCRDALIKNIKHTYILCTLNTRERSYLFQNGK